MKKLYEKIRNWLVIRQERKLKRKMTKKMVKNYEQNYQIELLLEEWIIKRILDGATDRRKELAEKQASIKEMSEFIKHFKKIKI